MKIAGLVYLLKTCKAEGFLKNVVYVCMQKQKWKLTFNYLLHRRAKEKAFLASRLNLIAADPTKKIANDNHLFVIRGSLLLHDLRIVLIVRYDDGGSQCLLCLQQVIHDVFIYLSTAALHRLRVLPCDDKVYMISVSSRLCATPTVEAYVCFVSNHKIMCA